MRLPSILSLALFVFSIFACGSTTLERTDDGSSRGAPSVVTDRDAGSSARDSSTSTHDAASTGTSTGSTNAHTQPSTGGGFRCAPGADCNGVWHCSDDEFQVDGNGTCRLDCDCSDGTGASGTLRCQIWACE
jgi:hypothetical protein